MMRNRARQRRPPVWEEWCQLSSLQSQDRVEREEEEEEEESGSASALCRRRDATVFFAPADPPGEGVARSLRVNVAYGTDC